MEKKKPCRKNYLSKYPSYLYHLSLKCCWRKKKIISRIEHVDSFSSNLGRPSLALLMPRLSPTGMKIIVTRADTFLFWPANCYILLWLILTMRNKKMNKAQTMTSKYFPYLKQREKERPRTAPTSTPYQRAYSQ